MSGNGYLTECEREPLNLSGQIQPHGALLILDDQGRISHVSDNIDVFLPGEAPAWLGLQAPECLRELADALPHEPGARLVGACRLDDPPGALDVVASRSRQDRVTLELSRPGPAPAARVGDPAASPLDRQALLAAVSGLTGFERVMYYRFMDNGDGEVLDEIRRGEVYGSYLGLRFPASDIPRIARHLYLCNPWRWIPDASAEPVAILGRDSEAPDLTWSDLRSVSPVHREYLGNMGVRAALSFPVRVNGELHALVACHHSSPGRLGMPVLEQISQRVTKHAQVLATELARQRMRLLDTLGSRFGQARAILDRHGELFSAWSELGPWLMREFDADGALLCGPDQLVATGLELPPEALAALDARPELFGERSFWISDSLSRDLPGLPHGSAAGVLVVRPGRGLPSEGCILLTRGEHIEEIHWGGNPHKPPEHLGGRSVLSPRRSFEKWVERRIGHCRPWGKESSLMAYRVRELLAKAPRG